MRRVLLDENLPNVLAPKLVEHEVVTVEGAGWKGVKNGQLLRLASGEFDVFLTADRSIPHQQPVAKMPLGFVILAIGSLALNDIVPYLDQISEEIERVGEGEVIHIRRPPRLA